MTDMMHFMGRQNDLPPYTMPLVVRAREYHLYDREGKRYIDFFQNHGRAILGHRPDGILRAMKSTASRGLLAEYPSVYPGRLEKIVEQLLPGYRVVRLYDSRRFAIEALRQVFGPDDAPLVIADPALADIPTGQTVAFWRPFLADVEVNAEVLIPILPFPGNFICEMVCAKDPTVADQLPPSDAISPLVIDLMVKTIGDLLSMEEKQRKRFFRKTYLHALMRRTCGPYCVTSLDDAAYRKFHAASLDAGVLLPPTQDAPIIIPPVFTEGEVARFLPIAEEFLGKR